MEGLSLDPRAMYNHVKMRQSPVGTQSTEGKFQDLLNKKQGTKGSDQAKLELKKACQAMESVFIEQMLKQMRKNVQKTKLLDGGFAEDVFSDMLYTEYAQKMAESDSIGLGKMMYKNLEHLV